MAELSPVSPVRAANAFTMQAADSLGDTFLNTGKELVLIEHTNGAGSDVDLTVTTTKTIDGEAVEDKVITIPAGTLHLLGPFQPGYYNDQDGYVSLSYSSETDMEVAVLKP